MNQIGIWLAATFAAWMAVFWCSAARWHERNGDGLARWAYAQAIIFSAVSAFCSWLIWETQ